MSKYAADSPVRPETPPLAAHDCEIPAYAGMVLWGNGELWAYFGGRIRRIVGHDTVRFLPTQEWSAGEWGIVGGFWRGEWGIVGGFWRWNGVVRHKTDIKWAVNAKFTTIF